MRSTSGEAISQKHPWTCFEQEQAAPLAGTEDAYGPFFSPDGQFVGFFADGKLKRISLQGGAPVELCDAPMLYGASWGEDGNIIAAFSVAGGLSRVPSSGGAAQPFTELKQERAEHTHRWPQVLPGANAVLFTANTTTVGFDGATIEVQMLGRGRERPWFAGATTDATCQAGICCMCGKGHYSQRLWIWGGSS